MKHEQLRTIGNSLYKTHIAKEMKRYLVYLGRCYLHKDAMEQYLSFWEDTPLRQEILAHEPSFGEQITRSFFYKKATWAERMGLVRHHELAMERYFTPELLRKLYVEHAKVTLWETEFEEHPLQLNLWFHPGQRKEGCLSLVLTYQGEELYQLMFWFSPTREQKDNAIWVGALQGKQQNGAVVKAMTKAFFGYRTKNLIFYGLRQVAQFCQCDCIYAVTNAGYYAMNHLRRDRKLKVNFADFWEECGGAPTEDPRFYQIPVEEYRKDMSELKPSKRAQHRRRFEMLDEITSTMLANLEKYRAVEK